MLSPSIKELAREKGYQSFDKLAEALIAQAPNLPDLPAVRTLSAYIGKLNKGDETWFRRRKPVASALAALLGMALDELLPPTVQAKALWRFEEFPQLLGLDLEREDPCDVFKPARRSSSAFAAWLPIDSGLWHIVYDLCFHRNNQGGHEPLWISTPPGSGKRLISKWAAARNWAEYFEVSRLSEAVGVVKPGLDGNRALILVAESDPEGDQQALAQLAAVKAITILAPFRFPVPGRADDDQSRANPRDGGEKSAGWAIKQWELASDWRRRLLEWISSRLAQSSGLFTPGPVLEWLDKHDPRATSIPTPGDLLPICALAHNHGERWLLRQTSEKLSSRLVESLTERLPEDAEGRLWLNSRAPKLLQQLLTKRLSDLAAPLRGGSSPHVWASYLEETAPRPPMSQQAMSAGLDQLARLKGEALDRAKERFIKRVTTPDAMEAIWLLKRTRVLRTDRTGGLAAYPRWSQEYCLKEAAKNGVRLGESAIWGRWSVGHERRQLLDDALDMLRQAELLEHIESVLSGFDPGQLGCVGAIESLFAAVARQLAGGWRPNDRATVDLLHKLWARAESQRAPVDHRAGALRCPRTRIENYMSYAEDFVASCWAWSFWLPTPQSLPTHDPPALWPGWVPVSLRDIAALQMGYGRPSWADQSVNRYVGADRMFGLLGEFLNRCSDSALTPNLPSLFVVHAVVHAAQHGWSLEPAVNLWWEKWHTQALLAWGPKLSLGVQRRIADWHVELIISQQSGTFGGKLEQLALNDSRLHQFIWANADWDKVRKHLAKFPYSVLVSDLAKLPDSLQQWAIRELAARQDLEIESLTRSITESTNAPPLELRLRLLVAISESREDCGHTLPRALYELSLEQGLQTADRWWRKNPASEQTFRWFAAAPKSMAARQPLLALIKALAPEQRPSWVGPFLWTMLHSAGEHTDELFRLIHGCK